MDAVTQEREVTQKPAEDEIARVLAYFGAFPHELPRELVHRAVRDMIGDAVNDAAIMRSRELEEYASAHPHDAWVIRTMVESYALVHGLRLVDDRLISQSIREATATKKNRRNDGLFKRIGRAIVNSEALERTAIIKKYEGLAADIAALDAAKRQLDAQIRDGEKMCAEATRKMIGDASEKADEILKNASVSADTLREKSEKCVVSLSAEATKLEGEIARMRAIADELAADPKIVAAAKEKKLREDAEKTAIEMINQTISGKCADYAEAASFYHAQAQLLKDCGDILIPYFLKIEEKFGEQEKIAIVLSAHRTLFPQFRKSESSLNAAGGHLGAYIMLDKIRYFLLLDKSVMERQFHDECDAFIKNPANQKSPFFRVNA